VLATFTSTSGALDAHLDADGRHVVIAAECGGGGTVTIRLGDGWETDLACGKGQPKLVMAESVTALRRFTCTTTTRGRPVWALTIGVVVTSAD
jgi:hypothetical protein